MLPEEFLQRIQWQLGQEYPEFLASYDRESCHGLRINTEKTSQARLREQVSFLGEPVPWCEQGFYYQESMEPGARPGKHPFHAAGVYYIQDPSAMAPVEYLDPQPGERILDLCAAPGGKSTQIGVKIRNQGILVCNEIHPSRAKILSENIERMGISCGIVTSETPNRLAEAFGCFFHRILVDAPCSGEGMFRKNSEACQEWSLENVELCGTRQDEILESAAEMLLPGGRLVYSTCTFAPLENEGTISRFLKRHPEFTLESPEKKAGMEPGVPAWTEDSAEGLQGTIRLWPHRIQGEGHFLAVLKKEGEPGPEKLRLLRGRPEKDYPEYTKFVKEYSFEMPNGVLVPYGEQLYLAPEGTPSLDYLKVLRPGLHLGTCRKNRFEPGHALALASGLKSECPTFELASDSSQVTAYLRGETLPVQGEKGWYLITSGGYSLGWGKLAGGIMKNHYPKGLRQP